MRLVTLARYFRWSTFYVHVYRIIAPRLFITAIVWCVQVHEEAIQCTKFSDLYARITGGNTWIFSHWIQNIIY